MPLGPSKRALILDKLVRFRFIIGLKWNSCSPKWQPLFLKDWGVRYYKVNAGLGHCDKKWWL